MATLALLTVAPSAQAAFPGANGKIAFSDDSGFGDIWVRNVDGTGLTQLTDTFAQHEAESAWSPDGTKIAYGRRGDSFTPYNVWLMDADGSNQTQLTNSRFTGDDDFNNPAWSPDGTKIAFEETNHATIWTMNPDGSAKTAIAANAWDPAWSPDGDRIAFRFGNLHVMNADGTGRTTLEAMGCCSYDPAWSPDGKKIVFSNTSTGTDRLYVVNADGSGLTTLTPGRQDMEPAWSPDGTKIAYVTTRDPDISGFKLHLVNADGSNDIRLTGPSREERYPDWQPLPGPQRSDFKNAAQFCKAERDFLGDEAFMTKYGGNGSGSNAFGRCVSASAGGK